MATNRGIQKADPFEIKFKRKILPLLPGFNPHIEVTNIQQDQKDLNIYWLGTAGSGLLQWNKATNTYKGINDKKNMPGMYISYIQQDEDGNLWLATENGLTSWNPLLNIWKNWQAFFPEKEADHSITTVFPDTKGRI